MINPYLIHLLSFEEKTLSSLTKEELVSTLREKGYGVEPAPRYIGNFHPYRHALLKEVIELKKEKRLHAFCVFIRRGPKGSRRKLSGVVPYLVAL